MYEPAANVSARAVLATKAEAKASANAVACFMADSPYGLPIVLRVQHARGPRPVSYQLATSPQLRRGRHGVRQLLAYIPRSRLCTSSAAVRASSDVRHQQTGRS